MKNSLGNKEIMARNIKHYLDLYEMTQTDLCEALGFKFMTVSDWVNAKSYPRIDKIEKMANFFKISKADLVEDHTNDVETSLINSYITDSKIRELVLFAGGIDPVESRNKFIDAVISTYKAFQNEK